MINITPFSFLSYASTETILTAVYLKEFVITTIFSGRMMSEKIIIRYCSKYISKFQGALTRGVPETKFSENAETRIEVQTS